jgi:PTS system beta-glucosides-specific IIC component
MTLWVTVFASMLSIVLATVLTVLFGKVNDANKEIAQAVVATRA